MAASRSSHEYVAEATALLERARAADEVGRAVQALTLVGRAAQAVGWDLDGPEGSDLRTELVTFARDDAATLGWGSLNLAGSVYGDDPERLVDAPTQGGFGPVQPPENLPAHHVWWLPRPS